jgi:hypothetical protein
MANTSQKYCDTNPGGGCATVRPCHRASPVSESIRASPVRFDSLPYRFVFAAMEPMHEDAHVHGHHGAAPDRDKTDKSGGRRPAAAGDTGGTDGKKTRRVVGRDRDGLWTTST